MKAAHPCPRCGAALPRDGALSGLCAACLLRGSLDEPVNAERADAGRAESGSPDLSGVQRDFPELEILELLGRGGMGLVYKARQTRLNRLVALKVLAPDLAQDPFFAERFLREAQALAALDHPNVVTIHDFGERQGRYFLLMEYVDGTSLRTLLEGGRLAPAEALALVPAVCAGLQYAHEQGIVHRDIKPENVLVSKCGGVKIADFGLVKLLDKDEGDWRLTRASQVMGTPQYMAPEQMNRPREVDHRADIYSLGVVLYEMLTGELPLGRFALPSERAPVDARLDEVVLRALEREPERRFQHARELGTRVHSISTSDFVRAEPPPLPSPRRFDPSWPAARRLSFTNSVDKWGGVYVVYGLVGLEDDCVVLEYRVRNCFGLGAGEAHELRIPVTALGAAEFKSSWFSVGEVVLTGRRLDCFADFPVLRPGAIRLRFDQDIKDDARRLTEMIRARIERAAI